MPAKVFIDTNLVIYSLGQNSVKASVVAPLLASHPFISTQVLSETANVALKKLAISFSEVRKLLRMLETSCQVAIITPSTILHTMNIAERYQFSWFDSLIVATALEAGCETLYTEDLQHLQIIEGSLTVHNPFII
jgi:predicted nucleic acid-binding protein